MESITVPGAWFVGVVGSPRRSGPVLFVPALLDVLPPTARVPWQPEPPDGWVVTGDGPAVRVPEERIPDADNPDAHALWARSRAVALFGWMPPAVEISRPLLDAGFVAVVENAGGWRADPFVLAAHWGEIGLEFGQATKPARRKAIAAAFWELMLADPFEVVPFRVPRMVPAENAHDESAVRVAGLDRLGFYGEPLGWDFEDEPDEDEDMHFTVLTNEVWACPECGGSGEEAFFPAGALCDACRGSGWVGRTEPRAEHVSRSRRSRFRDAR